MVLGQAAAMSTSSHTLGATCDTGHASHELSTQPRYNILVHIVRAVGLHPKIGET